MNVLFDIGMAVLPVTGYVMQYRLINKNKTVGAFSIDICAVLLFSNILRLNFYIFNQYQLALLFQSIIMITAQIFLLKICTKYAEKVDNISMTQKNQKGTLESEAKLEVGFKNPVKESFWRWSNFSSYGNHLIMFIVATFSVSTVFKMLQFSPYGELVGLVALLSESILILPQIIGIIQKKRVKGISIILLVLNWSGDIVKLVYFVMNDQPFQFMLCGIIQIVLDSFIILQIIYFIKIASPQTEEQIFNDEFDIKYTNKTSRKEIENELEGKQAMEMGKEVGEIKEEIEKVINDLLPSSLANGSILLKNMEHEDNEQQESINKQSSFDSPEIQSEEEENHSKH